MPLNPEVSAFIDQQNHPLRTLIDVIRSFIVSVEPTLSENIKWNGPNFSHEGQDRITVKINPYDSRGVIPRLPKASTLQKRLQRSRTLLHVQTQSLRLRNTRYPQYLFSTMLILHNPRSILYLPNKKSLQKSCNLTTMLHMSINHPIKHTRLLP